MTTFLIVVGVLVVLFAIILSLSAEVSIIYDNELEAKVKFLFIEKELDLDAILSKLLVAKDKTEQIADSMDENVSQNNQQPVQETVVEPQPTTDDSQQPIAEEKPQTNADETPQPAKKPNIIKQIYDKDGVLGILLMISTLLQTVNSAIITLIKGFHIHSLYVKMIIGGSDAAQIAIDYGKICGVYFPLKGLILSTMKVDNCDDYIAPDFIAPRSEYEFQLIMSLSIGAVLKVALVAVKQFLVNLIKNK